MRLHLIHIPKTGGTSLAAVLPRWVQRNGHPFRLSMLEPDDLAITVMRDPVARYQSGLAYLARTPSASEEEVMRPQSWWLDGDLGRLLWVGRTDRLEEDARHLFLMLGIEAEVPRLNASPTPHPPVDEAAVRARYADDYRLLDELT